eukprot:gnl/Chilomastix_cuspidata/4537.p1 GENE.gnl/Chilomastix_cuspidata/4537~~gnl/Chilomastix_cuspidata/4537.p1  ORF type:complete len:831 (-),score=332.23 gnl/Chilomastix_cuspidata/4537:878-3166(-)
MRVGRVKRLLLENFLIHETLSVEFDKRVTLVHGPNGSGKSAIFQALLFVFGMSAKHVRHGATNYAALRRRLADPNELQPPTRVTAWLCNRGAAGDRAVNGFHGAEIVIERRISGERSVVKTRVFDTANPDGTKPRGGTREVISTTSEVAVLLARMGIYPDNFVLFMGQQSMKDFATENPETRYRFVAEALLFSRQVATLADIRTKVERAANQAEQARRLLRERGDEIRDLEKRISDARCVEAVKRELADMRREAERQQVWRLRDLEADARHELDIAASRLKVTLDRHRAASTRLEEAKEKKDVLRLEISEQRARLVELQEHEAAAQRDEALAFQRVSNAEAKLQAHRFTLSNGKDKLSRCVEERDAMKTEHGRQSERVIEIAASIDGLHKELEEKERLVARLDAEGKGPSALPEDSGPGAEEKALLDELRTLRARSDELKESMNPANRAVKTIIEDLQDLKGRVQTKREDVSELQHRLQKLKDAQKQGKTVSKADAFSSTDRRKQFLDRNQRVLNGICAKIQKSMTNRSYPPPMGPIAAHIWMPPQHKRWFAAANTAVAGIVNSSVAYSERDTAQIHKLVSAYNSQLGATRGGHLRASVLTLFYDKSRHLLEGGLRLASPPLSPELVAAGRAVPLMDVIETSSFEVTCALAVHAQLDRVALFAEERDAQAWVATEGRSFTAVCDNGVRYSFSHGVVASTSGRRYASVRLDTPGNLYVEAELSRDAAPREQTQKSPIERQIEFTESRLAEAERLLDVHPQYEP